jgi:hypothetical protein
MNDEDGFSNLSAVIRQVSDLQRKGAFADLPNQAAQVQKMLTDTLTGYDHWRSEITKAVGSVVELHRQLHDAMEPTRRAIEMVTRLAPSLGDHFIKVAAQIHKIRRACDKLKEAGWLPHDTTPNHLLRDDDMSAAELRNSLDAYYRDGWPTIAAAFLKRLDAFEIDEEAKEAFREAIAAHGNGHHRMTVRGLFPELERVARIELQGDPLRSLAGQPTLREIVARLPAGAVVPDGFFSVPLYMALSEHAYENVHTSQAHKRFSDSPIPNRHAALHGLVSYTSHQSSVNALILADYIFEIITAIKSLSRLATIGR